MDSELTRRVRREVEHGEKDVALHQADFGWDSPAGKIRRARRARFLTRGLSKEAKVLEVGAGTGLQTEAILKAVKEVVAIDISPNLLAVARKRAPGATYRIMDAHSPDFPEKSFDAILGVSILHHLNWSVALKNYWHLLKPRGILRFSEPNLLNPQIYLQKNITFLKRLAGDSPDEYAFTRWRISRDLRDAGFVEIKVVPYEFLHPATPVLAIPLVLGIESLISRTPLNEIAGSLLIEAKRPHLMV